MADRYIITGVQLGMLVGINNLNDRQEIAEEIIDKGYIGNKESPEFKKIKEITARLRRRAKRED